MPASTEIGAGGRIARCPRCGSSTRLDPANPWRPFCSERCKLIDLGEWFAGRYAIPGAPLEASDDAPTSLDDLDRREDRPERD